MTRKLISMRVIVYEAVAFGFLYFFEWADEIFDIPHTVFGLEPTPINWSEALIESTITFILAVITINLTWYYLREIRYLEGLLPVCSVCKKIKEDNGEWVPFEIYVRDHSGVKFTHGLCPDCAESYYEEIERLGK